MKLKYLWYSLGVLGFSALVALAAAIGAGNSLTVRQQTPFKYNTITYASTFNVDLGIAAIQKCTLTGNITLNSTNRPTKTGDGIKTTVLLTASGADRTVTLNAGWRVYGTNSTLTVLSGKQAYVSILGVGPLESDVIAAFDHQVN